MLCGPSPFVRPVSRNRFELNVAENSVFHIALVVHADDRIRIEFGPVFAMLSSVATNAGWTVERIGTSDNVVLTPRN